MSERTKWFAWYPVRCEDGTRAWLEWVWREVDRNALRMSVYLGAAVSPYRYYRNTEGRFPLTLTLLLPLLLFSCSAQPPTPKFGIVVERVHHPAERQLVLDTRYLYENSRKKPKPRYKARIQEEEFVLVLTDSSGTDWNFAVDKERFYRAHLGDTLRF